MKFKYVGDHDSVSAYGYTFPRDEEVDVNPSMVLYRKVDTIDKSKFTEATLGEKLRGNPEFKEVRVKKDADA